MARQKIPDELKRVRLSVSLPHELKDVALKTGNASSVVEKALRELFGRETENKVE